MDWTRPKEGIADINISLEFLRGLLLCQNECVCVFFWPLGITSPVVTRARCQTKPELLATTTVSSVSAQNNNPYLAEWQLWRVTRNAKGC